MKAYALRILIATVLQLATAELTPRISYISPELVKDIGDTADLRCSVQDAQDFPVVWIKVGDNYPLIISVGSSLVVPDNRYSVRFDAASSSYTLKINDVEQTDAGRYQCQVKISKNKTIIADVDLLFRSKAVINDNSTSAIVTSEGHSVQLECYASGYPQPNISWRRENNEILPNGEQIYWGNILEIVSIRKEDRGTYFCTAENGVGRRAIRRITVAVEFAPVISTPSLSLNQSLQYDMDLVCQVEAYPPPAIIWMKDGVRLSSNQHYSISHFATTDEFTYTAIRVIAIEKQDYGQYVCKAVNKLGTSEARVELIESTTPVCPPACGQAHDSNHQVHANATETPVSSTETPVSSTEAPVSSSEPSY